jgi:hypothetical protein
MDREKQLLFMNIIFCDEEESQRLLDQLNEEEMKEFLEFLEENKDIQLPSDEEIAASNRRLIIGNSKYFKINYKMLKDKSGVPIKKIIKLLDEEYPLKDKGDIENIQKLHIALHEIQLSIFSHLIPNEKL